MKRKRDTFEGLERIMRSPDIDVGPHEMTMPGEQDTDRGQRQKAGIARIAGQGRGEEKIGSQAARVPGSRY